MSHAPPQTPATVTTASRPGWNQGAIWMGASLSALLRILRRNHFRVAPRYTFDLAFDTGASVFNSLLGGMESALWRKRLQGVDLPTDPLIVLGHWRTGTTLLHELLALDPRHRAPTTYECLLPHHFLLSDSWLRPWTEFTLPKTRGFDNVSVTWSKPQEEELALALLGQGTPYTRIAFPNEACADSAYLDLEALPAAELARWEQGLSRFLRRLLALRAGRLILKSPPHTCRVPTLLRMFPNAKFIYVVRDPTPVYSSTLKLWRTLYAVHGYQKPRFEHLEEEVIAGFAHFHERFEATKNLIPAGSLLTVKYEELVADPSALLKRTYASLDLGNFGAVASVIGDYLAKQRDYRPNHHELDEATRELLRERWRGYYDLHAY